MSDEQKVGQYRPVEVEIGERTMRLRMTMRAMRAIRDETDGRVDFFEGGVEQAEPYDFPIIVWACLRHKGEGGDPDLTLEDLEETLEVGDIERIADAVFRMFGFDFEQAMAMHDAMEAEDTDAGDPLGARAASATPTSSSSAKRAPSSGSPTSSSGSPRPESTPRPETPTREPSEQGTGEPAS